MSNANRASSAVPDPRDHMRDADRDASASDTGVRRAGPPTGRRSDSSPSRVSTLHVRGMDCASCAGPIEDALRRLDGVRAVSTDTIRERVTVEHAAEANAPSDFVREVARLGYVVEEQRPQERRRAPAVGSWWHRRGRIALVVAAGVLFAASLVLDLGLDRQTLAAAAAVGAVAAGGRFVFPRGLRALRSRALDMNVLMSVAALGGLAIGEFAEAASVMFLFALAQLLETRSMDRARNAIRSLMELSPAEATVMRDGREVRVPADRVRVGEVVVVRPGEKLPVDGVVVAGRSTVNQAPITGESLPVEKAPDSEVFAGTLNGEGAIEVRSTRPAEDTTLARIIHAVEEAQATRAPSQAFVDRFARVYTPAVVGAAAGLALLPPLLGVGGWGEWIYRALVLLVVACPCALVISTPVTIVSALAGAARRGILVKGGLHLENAGRAGIVALDKTGTLTTGEPEVVEIVGLNGATPEDVLRLAARAERRSEHPLGRAVMRAAAARGIEAAPAAMTETIAGLGVRARCETGEILVGTESLFRRAGMANAEVERPLGLQRSRGRTAVLVGSRSGPDAALEPTGLIAFADRVRPEATAAIRGLRAAGIERIVVLTGDHAATARAVGTALERAAAPVDEIRAGLLPEAKLRAVRELQRHGPLIMVGDGINDAPALAAADVGVAMGAAGTDTALETADLALMADDLGKLPTTVRLARKAERIIRVNIGFALALKAAFVALAVLGIATLWMAVLADMGASLLVIANGMRALRA